MARKALASASAGVAVTTVGENTYRVDMAKDRSVTLTPDGSAGDATIRLVDADPARIDFWSLNEHRKASLSEDARR
jgi:hypothetical protein